MFLGASYCRFRGHLIYIYRAARVMAPLHLPLFQLIILPFPGEIRSRGRRTFERIRAHVDVDFYDAARRGDLFVYSLPLFIIFFFSRVCNCDDYYATHVRRLTGVGAGRGSERRECASRNATFIFLYIRAYARNMRRTIRRFSARLFTVCRFTGQPGAISSPALVTSLQE